MAARGLGLFSLYIYVENFKNLLVRCRPQWHSWMRRPTGDQEVAGSTPAEVDNILSWRLIMKYFLRSFSPFRWFEKGSCQFLAKECAQYWPCLTWPHCVDWAVKPQHKQILIRYGWTDFNITWQKYFFGNPLLRLFKLSWFVKKKKKNGCKGAGHILSSLYIYIENFKNLLVRNHWTIFTITAEIFLRWPSTQDCSSRHDTSENMVARGQIFFSLYIYIENFQNVKKHGC